MNSFMQFIHQISDFGSLLEGLVNVSIVWIAFVYIRDLTYKRVDLSIGSFKVRRKDYNVQNITNLVSLHYYDGGMIPDEIRGEILRKTSPKIKNLTVANGIEEVSSINGKSR